MKTVIEMAREAGFMGHEDSFYTNHRYGDCKLELERFAALVRADEREADARLIAAAPDLLEALKAMEDRFGCRSSRQEDQPKTYGCHHLAETCTQCEGLVTGWKAVQAARAAITKATGETK